MLFRVKYKNYLTKQQNIINLIFVKRNRNMCGEREIRKKNKQKEGFICKTQMMRKCTQFF